MPSKKIKRAPTKRLFRDPSGQEHMFEKSLEEELEAKKNAPVECQGMTFQNDEKRREYFLAKLREKLKDPEFRKIEGFPIGADEDILALSDPPYYTACPNPFIADFIKYYGKPYDPKTDNYRREPFAVDSRFGKTSNAITRAHPYHTKVPPEAVQDFVGHYLGDSGVALDCFCGIGMAGLGVNYHNKKNNAQVGTILADLSTISTFVTYHYNSYENPHVLEELLHSIASELENHIKESFVTLHNGWRASAKQSDVFDQKNRKTPSQFGTVQYIIVSEELSCPNCGEPNLIWRKDCVDMEQGRIHEQFLCNSCRKLIAKKECSKIWETHPDPCVSGGLWKMFRQKPVLIYYEYAGETYCKYPDTEDLKRIGSHWTARLSNIPVVRIPHGDKTDELINGNTEYFHQCYHPMVLAALDHLFGILKELKGHCLFRRIKFALSPVFTSLTRMAVVHVSHFFKGGGGPFISNISGFLHFPSISFLRNPVTTIRLRAKSVIASLDSHVSLFT